MKKWLKASRISALSRLCIRAFILCMTLFYSGVAWAACSSNYEGLAVINEVSDSSNFIEIKVLTSAIGPAIYDNWTLNFCSLEDGKKNDPVTCSGELSLSAANKDTYPWLVMDSQDLGGKIVDLRALEIRLSDSNGDTIDYLRVADLSDSDAVDEVSNLDDPECDVLKEVDSGGGNSGKLTKRSPDGSGDWALSPGGSGGDETGGSSNEGGDQSIVANINNVTVERGSTANLTVELGEALASDVVITYETLDGTAEAGSDYEFSSSSVTIAAGSLTATVPVPTINNGEQVTEEFRVVITGVSPNDDVVLGSQIGIVTLTPIQGRVNYFEIVHDGKGLTCQPEEVTIRACANADDDCFETFSEPVEVTLAPSGWVGGDTFTFTGNTTRSLRVTTPDTAVTLSVASSDPAASASPRTLCDNGTGTSSADNCDITYYDSGLAFDIPDMISHREEQNIQVRAVQRDPQTDQCVPAFENVDRTVGFWSTYTDPDANGRPVSRPVSVDGTDVSGAASSPTPLNLSFGAGGVAVIDVLYPDAGQMQLDALYQGSAANDDEGLVMPGSDIFTSRPAGLCVSSAGECDTADGTCPAFVRAGEEFDLSLTAVGWQSDSDTDLCTGNPTTPNFAMPDIGLASELVEPSAGVSGTFSPLTYDHTPSADATTVVPSTVSEVGVFRFNATPIVDGYFGQTVPAATSRPAGRFYPDRFIVSVDPGEFQAECVGANSFTYTGQEFSWLMAPSVLIEPVSVSGSRTLNYADPAFTDPADQAFQKLTAIDISRTVPLADVAAQNADGDPLAVTALSDPGLLSPIAPGLLEFEYSASDTVSYDKVMQARVGPVISPALDFIIDSIEDSDSVAGVGAPFTVSPAMNFEIRYGRLFLENAYGPETMDLRVPFQAQVWNGSRFVLHVDDNCWAYNTADAVITDTPPNTSVTDLATGTLEDGAEASGANLMLEAPGANNTGSVLVRFPVPGYLQDDFDGNGSLEDPTATATFGVYRGHDRVIYWRER